MKDWPDVLKKMQVDYAQNPNNELLEEIVRSQYGLIAYYIGANKDTQALEVIDDAHSYLQLLENKYPDEGWVYALSATFKSFKLIINPYRFFLKGVGILAAIDKSEDLSPNHPDVLFFKANQTFYLPSYLGGNQTKGLSMYNNLSEKLIRDWQPKSNNWFHLLYLTSYGIACTQAKDYKTAVKIYDQILQLEPQYDWVRNELIPQAENHLDNAYLKQRKKDLEKAL